MVCRTETPVPKPKNSSGKYANQIVTGGVGHNLPGSSQAFAKAIVDVDVFALP
jgi:hypothetical protein